MTAERLKRKIKTAEELKDIVTNMKMLSSASIMQYEKAGEALDAYAENLRDAFRILALQNGLPRRKNNIPRDSRRLYVLIGSDNGMVGGFNREIIRKLESESAPDGTLYITVGKRAAMAAEAHKLSVFKGYAVSNSLKTVMLLAEYIITDIEEAMRRHHAGSVYIISNRRGVQGRVLTECEKIIPFDTADLEALRRQKWDTNNIPQLADSAEEMFKDLTGEALRITAARKINASLTAEHFIRMTNMRNSEKNIEENLENLNLEYQRQRQEDITDELIDVISGAEAMNKKNNQ